MRVDFQQGCQVGYRITAVRYSDPSHNRHELLAGVLSRNPAGLKENELRDLMQPDNLMVHAINLNIGPGVTHDLVPHQAADQRLARIKERLNKYPNQADPKYKLWNRILYSIDQKHHPFWRPMLPSTLDNPVIKYVHTSLGHLGVDKCMDQIAHSFHIKNLGRKIRKFIARCDTSAGEISEQVLYDQR